MKSEIRKIIEEFDSSAKTFSMRVPELCNEVYKNAISGYVGVKGKFRDFLIHEKLITNDELFWIMWGNSYIGTPQVHSFHEEIACPFKRNKIRNSIEQKNTTFKSNKFHYAGSKHRPNDKRFVDVHLFPYG